MKPKSQFAIVLLTTFVAANWAIAQTQAAGGMAPPNTTTQSSPKNHLSPPSQAPQTASSLLSQPAQPARIQLTAGKLTVNANNSTLAEILDQISHASGMKIQGLQAGGKGDQRIFGTYGPDAPHAVLNDLLNGSGYNILMLGTTPSGVPSELMLSLQSSGEVPASPPQAQQPTRDDYQEYPSQPENQQPVPMPHAQEGVRTPQQMLQDLQRRRELEQQQQEQQQQQQDQDENQ